MEEENSILGTKGKSFELVMDKDWMSSKDQSFVQMAQAAMNNDQQLMIAKSRRVGSNSMANFMRQSMDAQQKAFNQHADEAILAMQEAIRKDLIGSDLIKHNRRKLK